MWRLRKLSKDVYIKILFEVVPEQLLARVTCLPRLVDLTEFVFGFFFCDSCHKSCQFGLVY
jgi:hypothetical protein